MPNKDYAPFDVLAYGDAFINSCEEEDYAEAGFCQKDFCKLMLLTKLLFLCCEHPLRKAQSMMKYPELVDLKGTEP